MALYEAVKLCIFYWIVRGAHGFRTGNESCNETFSGYQFAISSPKYPETYPRNSECFYVLQGKQLTLCQPVFYMQFLDFDLEATENCVEDYLKIGGSNIFCGTATGLRKFQAENGELRIVFRSGERNKGRRGFKILVTTSDCTEKRRFVDEQISLQNTSSTNSTNLTRFSNEGNIERRKKFPPTTTTEKPEKNFSNLHQNLQISPYFYVPPAQQLGPRKADITFEKNAISFEPSTESFLPKGDAKINFHPLETLPIKESKINLPSIDCETSYKSISNFDNTGIEPISRELGPPSVINNGEEVPIVLTNPDFFPANNNPAGIFPNFSPNDDWNQNIPEVNSNSNDFSPTFQDTPIWHSSSSSYYPPQNNYPNAWNPNQNGYLPPQNNYPNEWNPNPNTYIPPQNNYPNEWNPNPSTYIPPQNQYPVAWPTNNQNYGNLQCCNTAYSQSKFLISSPGFPNFFYPQNSYDCYYHIQQASPDVCQIRINFKFFNFGLDDPSCSYGFVEIDGQKICGCKTRISLVAPFTNSGGKFLRVHYTGFPRTKASGFLMEIVQESCHYNYGPRYKKEISENNENKGRGRRSLGYTYPKPGDNGYPNGGSGSCQTRLIFDWMLASKEAYLGNARCAGRNNFSGRNRRETEKKQDSNRSPRISEGS